MMPEEMYEREHPDYFEQAKKAQMTLRSRLLSPPRKKNRRPPSQTRDPTTRRKNPSS